MGHHSQCLEDIEAALMFGYPEDMQYKLMDRRGRCLLRCQRQYEAQEALELASLLVQKSKLSSEYLRYQFLVLFCNYFGLIYYYAYRQ